MIRWPQVRLPSVALAEEGVQVGPPFQVACTQSLAAAPLTRRLVTIGFSLRSSARRNPLQLPLMKALGTLRRRAVYA